MWISRRIVGLTVFAFTVVSACASAGPSSVAPSTSPSPGASAAIGIVGPTWIVTTIGGSDTVADARPTMTFGADGQVQGSGGCNSYGGPYKLDGPAIDVGDLASTMMLCQDQSIGAQETAFFAALGGAQTWQIEGTGDLVLAGVSQIVAKSAPADALGECRDGRCRRVEPGRDGPDRGLRPPAADDRLHRGRQRVGIRRAATRSAAVLLDGRHRRSPWVLSPRREMACQRPGSAVESDYPSAALRGVTGLGERA